MKALLIAIFGCILLGLALYFHYYYKSEKEGFQQEILGNIIETDTFLNSSQLPTSYEMNGNYIFHKIQTEHLEFIENKNNYKYVSYPNANVGIWGRTHASGGTLGLGSATNAGILGGDRCSGNADTFVSSEGRRFGDNFNVYLSDIDNYNSKYKILLTRTGDVFTNKRAKLELMNSWEGYSGNTLVRDRLGGGITRTYNRISGDHFCEPVTSVHYTNRYVTENGIRQQREDWASGGIPGSYGMVDNPDTFSALRTRLFNSASINAAVNEKLILNVYGNVSQLHINDFYTSLKLGVLFDFSDANKIYQYFRVPYNSPNLDGKMMYYSYGKFIRDVKPVSATQTFNYIPDGEAIRYNDRITSLIDQSNIKVPDTFDSNAIINNTFNISRTIPIASAGIEDKFVGTLSPTLLGLLPQTARRNITSIAYNQTVRILENKLDDLNIASREAWEPSCQRGSGNYFFRDPSNRTPYDRNRLVLTPDTGDVRGTAVANARGTAPLVTRGGDNSEINEISRQCAKRYVDINGPLTTDEKLTLWNFESAGTITNYHSNILKTNFLIKQASNNGFTKFLDTISISMPTNRPYRELYQPNITDTTIPQYPTSIVTEMVMNYKQYLAKLLPAYGGELKILDPKILNKIAQSFYEYSDGLFEINYIYEVLRVGSNMLDIRFDKKQRLPPNEFINLRSQYNRITSMYNSVLDMVNQGTWVTKYNAYDDAINELSSITARLDPVFNPIYPIGGIGTLQSLNTSLQANKVTMNTLSNQLDVMINETQTGLRNSNSNISSLVTTAPQVITDISVLQQNYNSTIESEYRITNLINGITTGVGRVFYTNNPFRVDGLALGIQAALSYNKAYNGNLDIDIGNSPGNVNYMPVIEYTKNIAPAIVCSNVDFMNRVAQIYTDNIYNSLSTFSSNVFLSNAGDVKIDKIIGFKQINNTTCGYTWQETEYDYYTNKPNVRRLVNAVLPFKFDNSIYQQPEILIDNSIANGAQVTYLSNIPLNRQNLDNSNLSNLNTRLASLRTELSNYIGSNLTRFNTIKTWSIGSDDFIRTLNYYGTELLEVINKPNYMAVKDRLYRKETLGMNEPLGLEYFLTLDNYVTLNRLFTVVEGVYLWRRPSGASYDQRVYYYVGAPLLKMTGNVENILNNKNFFDTFIERSNYYRRLINTTVAEISNLRSFTPVSQRPGNNNIYTFGTLDDNALHNLNKLISYNYKVKPDNTNNRTGIYNLFNDISNNENYYRREYIPGEFTPFYRITEPGERFGPLRQYFTEFPILYSYFYDNLSNFKEIISEMKKYNTNLLYQTNRTVPIRRILSDIENTLDNAGGACQPTYTCKSPEIMRQLLDQYNTDDSNSDIILRVMNAFTVSPYQCDYLVENRNRSGIAFSTTTVSKSFQVGVDFKECYYFIANYGSNNIGYYVSENQKPPVVIDSSDTDLSGFQYIGGVLYDYYNSVSNTIAPYIERATSNLVPRLFNALSNTRTETYGSMGMLNMIKVHQNPAYDFFGFVNLLSDNIKLKYLLFLTYPTLDSKINRIVKIGIVNSNTFDCLYEIENLSLYSDNQLYYDGTYSTRASRFTINATPGYNDYSFTHLGFVNPNVLRGQIEVLSNSPPFLQSNDGYLLSNTVNIVNDVITPGQRYDIIDIDPLSKITRLKIRDYHRRQPLQDNAFLPFVAGTILSYKKFSINQIHYKISITKGWSYNSVRWTDVLDYKYTFKRNGGFPSNYDVERIDLLPTNQRTYTFNNVNLPIDDTSLDLTLSPCPRVENLDFVYITKITGFYYLTGGGSLGGRSWERIQSRLFPENNRLVEFYVPTRDNEPYEKRFMVVSFYNTNDTSATCSAYDLQVYSIRPQNPTDSLFGIGYQNINIQTLVNIFKDYYNLNMTGNRLNLAYDAKIGKVHLYYKYNNLYIFKCSVFYYNKNTNNYFLSKIPDAEIFSRYKYYTVFFMNDPENPSSSIRVERMTYNEYSTAGLPADSSFSNITDTTSLTTPNQQYFIENFLFTGYQIELSDSYTFPTFLQPGELFGGAEDGDEVPRRLEVFRPYYLPIIKQLAQISFYKNTENILNIITLDINNVRNMDFTLLPTTPIEDVTQNMALECKYNYMAAFDRPTSINGYSFICGADMNKIIKYMNIYLYLGSDTFSLPAFNATTFSYSDAQGYVFPHGYFRTPIFYINGTTTVLPQYPSLYKFNLFDCRNVINPLSSNYRNE